MKIDPGLTFHDATKFIISKMIDFQTKMKGSPFVGNDATVTYRSFFTSSVFYGIEAISLDSKQCQQINKIWTVPWLHRLNFSEKANVQVRHMLVEDAGLELFRVENIMLLKKLKVLIDHLRVNDRIGIHIKSNVIQSQILSGIDKSIIQIKGVTMQFWPEEIGEQIFKLGAIINIEHWLPTPLISGNIPIMTKAKEMYTNMPTLLKINEMRLYHKIIYVSEIGSNVLFYNHHVKFPEVKRIRYWYIFGTSL